MQMIPGGMMGQQVSDTNTQWAIYAAIIVVSILGLISIYLNYMMLSELKQMKSANERIEKLLESLE